MSTSTAVQHLKIKPIFLDIHDTIITSQFHRVMQLNTQNGIVGVQYNSQYDPLCVSASWELKLDSPNIAAFLNGSFELISLAQNTTEMLQFIGAVPLLAAKIENDNFIEIIKNIVETRQKWAMHLENNFEILHFRHGAIINVSMPFHKIANHIKKRPDDMSDEDLITSHLCVVLASSISNHNLLATQIFLKEYFDNLRNTILKAHRNRTPPENLNLDQYYPFTLSIE